LVERPKEVPEFAAAGIGESIGGEVAGRVHLKARRTDARRLGHGVANRQPRRFGHESNAKFLHTVQDSTMTGRFRRDLARRCLPMPDISLTNNQGRDANVLAESVRIPVKVRWVDDENRQAASCRLLKGTIDRDLDALLEKAG